VPDVEFFTRTMPFLVSEDDGLVLTPQNFHNYDVHGDVWGHNNSNFYDLTVRALVDGYSGAICVGTNYIVRGTALHEVSQSHSSHACPCLPLCVGLPCMAPIFRVLRSCWEPCMAAIFRVLRSCWEPEVPWDARLFSAGRPVCLLFVLLLIAAIHGTYPA
jgi:hypothetical protein